MQTPTIILTVLLLVVLIHTLRTPQVQEQRYAHRIGFSADRFGSHFWLTLHLMALNQPRDGDNASIANFSNYIRALHPMIPCKMCRDEFGVMVRALPPEEFVKKGRVGAVAYIYTMHHIVSQRIGNPNQKIKFLEMEPKYLQEYTKPFSCDINKMMDDLHRQADERGIHTLIAKVIQTMSVALERHH